MNLSTPIIEVAGVGESHAQLLDSLGIHTIEDLLWYLPRRWDDYSKIIPIREAKPGEAVSIRGTVGQIANRVVKNKMNLTEAIISDPSGSMKAVWFNQPFLTKTIQAGDELFLAGTIDFSFGSIQMASPAYELVHDEEGETTHTGRIVPIYPETTGLTSKWLRTKIKPLMKYMYSIKDYLPESVKATEGLIDLPAAIRQLHFPENTVQLKKAMERLDFDEMFLLQLTLLNARKKLAREQAIAVPYNEELIKKFIQNLPFELTTAQRKAAWDIIQDLSKNEPMNRLLQGDVGSGKTVVAAMVMANVATSGAQVALLCPTEILAKQHFAKISEFLAPLGIESAVLVGSTPKAERDEILTRIREGEVKVIIGTHAILERDVEFWRLALAIVDEQHRFGVEQRAALKKESLSTKTLPHSLSMTATPIPRTLSLTLYGDLDLSIIYEMPKGRQKVITRIIPAEKRVDSYTFIRKEIEAGRQAFVVCPLVASSTVIPAQAGIQDHEDESKSVMAEYEKLAHEVFTDLKVDYIHGQMKTEEKSLAMSKFVSGETKLLVSSSVIEVGVDVPNATIMIIEDAERFGLAQLHQFRGRVGRGKYQSYCLLFTSSKAEIALKRLNALVHTDDGFKLADTDLEIRGPGDFIGARQHGLPDIKMKNLTNLELISRCREAAKKFLAKHEITEFPALAAKTVNFDKILNLE
jgi:ATP-dependent DNA helicase RecG